MKLTLFLLITLLPLCLYGQNSGKLRFYKADHRSFHYTGRGDFSNSGAPKFWQPGIYVEARFKGTECEILVNDEVLWGKSHNYISVIIDNGTPIRIKTRQKSDTLRIRGLADRVHNLLICKDTEAGIGYIEFAGVRCERLLKPLTKPTRKIEFIGNSITSGMGSDLSQIPCDSGEWYDQHNAYMSYAAQTARALRAQWHLSSVSGIGMIRSCCDMRITMPDVYDKVNMREGQINWDFKRYRPDIVTIALGQNDGKQDSLLFCTAYVRFLETVRLKNPHAKIICLTSPMADASLTVVLKNYITGIVKHMHDKGDKNLHRFFFSRSYNNGCGGHPDLWQHSQIAGELTDFIKTLMNW